MKKTLALLILAGIGALAVPALASANVPSYQDRADAKTFARAYWNGRGETYMPCASRPVELKFEPIHTPGNLGFVNMASTWNACTIHMNSRQSWNWSKLCTIVTHEYGHLLGIRHSSSPGSIMYPTYPNAVWGNRFPACEYDTPAPVNPELPPPA